MFFVNDFSKNKNAIFLRGRTKHSNAALDSKTSLFICISSSSFAQRLMRSIALLCQAEHHYAVALTHRYVYKLKMTLKFSFFFHCLLSHLHGPTVAIIPFCYGKCLDCSRLRHRKPMIKCTHVRNNFMTNINSTKRYNEITAIQLFVGYRF